MAEANAHVTSADHASPLDMEDVTAVRSRISWGAILAGSVLALALYFLLALLGGAIGFSISDKFDGRNIGIAAAVYAIFMTAVCLFVGGFVASQLTAGENKREAAVYGLLVWAAVFAMLLWLMATGVRAGFNTMVGVATAGSSVANATGQNTTQADFDEAARRAGYSQQQLDDFKQRVRNTAADAKLTDDATARARAEQTAREAGEVATRVTWWSFFGTLISMLAAALGGYVGAGPTYRLFAVPVVRPGYGRAGVLPASA